MYAALREASASCSRNRAELPERSSRHSSRQRRLKGEDLTETAPHLFQEGRWSGPGAISEVGLV